MEYVIFVILLVSLAVFVLWCGGIILKKAGFPEKWVFLLLVPILNIAMIWVFAFARWPNLKSDVHQDL